MNEVRPTPKQRATTRVADGYPRVKWTVEEFDSLAEHGFFSEADRIELIGGELVPMSPKGNRHEVVRGDFGRWLSLNLPCEVKVYFEPGWRADPNTYLEPDILVFPGDRRLEALPGTEVLLVIEVAQSSLAEDLGVKARTYPALGVREYWVVNAITLETTVHLEPSQNGYEKVCAAASNSNLSPIALPSLVVSMGALGIA